MQARYYVYVLYRDEERMRPFYVGKGCGERYKRHTYDAFYTWMKSTNRHKNAIVKRCMESFGRVPYELYAQHMTEGEALGMEVALIALWGREAHGGVLTNTTNGGEGISGYRHTAETLAIIRAKNTGQKRTPEQRARMSAWQVPIVLARKAAKEAKKLEAKPPREKKPPDLRTPEQKDADKRAKMSASAKARTDSRGRGVPKSEETKRKISATLTGFKHTDETRAKMQGRKCSDETRAKMTASHKARWAKLKEESANGAA